MTAVKDAGGGGGGASSTIESEKPNDASRDAAEEEASTSAIVQKLKAGLEGGGLLSIAGSFGDCNFSAEYVVMDLWAGRYLKRIFVNKLEFYPFS